MWRQRDSNKGKSGFKANQSCDRSSRSCLQPLFAIWCIHKFPKINMGDSESELTS